MRGTAAYVTVVVLLCVPLIVVGQIPGPPDEVDDILSIELWSIEDRIIHGDTSAEERFLREAQYTISGMVYGWSFRYVPRSLARGVEEEFELTASAQIEWGDPALSVRDVRVADARLYGIVDYSLDRFAIERRSAWESISTTRSAGVGRADLLDGTAGKIRAIEEAIQDAIEMHLRNVVPNRPREAYGDVLLAEPPSIRTDAGRYEARVAVLVRVEAVRPYLIY
jgi:hypothetical protein